MKNSITKINKVVPKVMSKEEFDKLSGPHKRIMIAKDALQMIKANLLVPRQSEYVSFLSSYEDFRKSEREKLKDISATSKEGKCAIFGNGCYVCAKGAIFLSTVMRTNKMNVLDVSGCSGEYKVCDKEKIFDLNQYNLIETTFEGFMSHSSRSIVMKFHRAYNNSTDRLVAILLNIIRNKGKFKPSDIVSKRSISNSLKVKNS